jgi:hypothetical protein
MRQMFQICGLAAAIVGVSASTLHAQTTAVGPYYATPSWDQTIACTIPSSCSRFLVLSNFNNEAVLDRETGLVWERTPDPGARGNWGSAVKKRFLRTTSANGRSAGSVAALSAEFRFWPARFVGASRKIGTSG